LECIIAFKEIRHLSVAFRLGPELPLHGGTAARFYPQWTGNFPLSSGKSIALDRKNAAADRLNADLHAPGFRTWDAATGLSELPGISNGRFVTTCDV
jgi:hypothetical protein